MKLFGMGAAGPDSLPSDDYLFAPMLGLASVTSGIGATRGQARPAAVLATWGIATELEKCDDDNALVCGIERASKAISRLSQSWNRSLVGPTAMIAALHVKETRARIVHAGRCRVSRIGADGLVAITKDHNNGHDIQYAPETTDVELVEGDELLLAGVWLQDNLTSEVIAQLCRKDRPLVARAIDLWDHATRIEKPFSFVMVRVVDTREDARLWGAGSRRPDPKFLPPPGEPFPPLLTSPFRSPDARWEKEMATPISHDATPQLAQPLEMIAEHCTFDIAVAALLSALRWTLQSFAARRMIPPAPVEALLAALTRTNRLDDWGPAESRLADDFYDAVKEELTDWGPELAAYEVVTAIECLQHWSASPESAQKELGKQLNKLACADARWEWDDGLAGVLCDMDESDRYWDLVIKREEREVRARRALLLILADFVDKAHRA
jgi:hypothetical protein